MKKRNLVLSAGLIAVAAFTLLAVSLPANEASAARRPQEAELDFTIQVSRDVSIEEIVTAVRRGANIGSSGQDGFRVDSFFDITYEVSSSPDGFDTEIVSLSLRAVPNDPNVNPGAVIDDVKAAVGSSGVVHKGHVTILK